METIGCIFCHHPVQIQDEKFIKNYHNYVSHLGKDHQIEFDMEPLVEHVINRTRKLRKSPRNIESSRPSDFKTQVVDPTKSDEFEDITEYVKHEVKKEYVEHEVKKEYVEHEVKKEYIKSELKEISPTDELFALAIKKVGGIKSILNKRSKVIQNITSQSVNENIFEEIRATKDEILGKNEEIDKNKNIETERISQQCLKRKCEDSCSNSDFVNKIQMPRRKSARLLKINEKQPFVSTDLTGKDNNLQVSYVNENDFTESEEKSVNDNKIQQIKDLISDQINNIPLENCMGSDEQVEENSNQGSNIKDIPWYNGTLLSCELCTRQFFDKTCFKKHVEKHHKDYQHINEAKCTERKFHECQICGKGVNWNRVDIRGHLMHNHNITLEKYYNEYGDDIEHPMVNLTDKTLLTRYREDTNKIISKTKNDKKLHSGFEWANKCVFKCALCDQELSSRRKFQTHLNQNHNSLTLTKYYKEHGNSIVIKKRHSCQIESCNVSLIWDKSNISRHIKNVHDMTIQYYRINYMDNYVEKKQNEYTKAKNPSNSTTKYENSWANRCIYKCHICEKIFQRSRRSLEIHVPTLHKMSMKEYGEKYGKSMEYEEKHSCQVENCNSKITWEKGCISNHLKVVHKSVSLQEYEVKYMNNYNETKTVVEPRSRQRSKLSWANRCIFKCKVCDIFETNSKIKFVKHIKIEHNLSKADYVQKYGRTMSHAEKHMCQIEDCGSSFLWSVSNFIAHFKLKHADLSLHEYEQQYMANYVESNSINGKTICHNSGGQNLDQDRYSECKFSCNICKPGRVFPSRLKAGKHMKTVHKTNLKDYKEKYGSSLVKKINHVCPICAGIFPWDKSTIRSHLYQVHKLPIEGYFKNNIDCFREDSDWLNKIKLKCQDCEKENEFSATCRMDLWKHVENVHQTSEMEYRNKYGSIYGPDLPKIHTCQICFAKINWETISLKPHIELKHEMTVQQYVDKFKDAYEEKRTVIKAGQNIKLNENDEVLQWTAGCLYKCNLCQQKIAGMYQLKKHLTLSHNLGYKEYEKRYDPKEFVLFLGFHLCKICQANVKHDYVPLQSHMNGHGLSIAEYINNHKPKAPKLTRKMTETEV